MDITYVFIQNFVQSILIFILGRYLHENKYLSKSILKDVFFAVPIAFLGLVLNDFVWIIVMIVLIMSVKLKRKRISDHYDWLIAYMVSCLININVLFITGYLIRIIIWMITRSFTLDTAMEYGRIYVIGLILSEIIFTIIGIYYLNRYCNVVLDFKNKFYILNIEKYIFLLITAVFISVEVLLITSEVMSLASVIQGVLVITFSLIILLVCYQTIMLIKSYSVRQEAINIRRQNVQLNGYMTNIEQQYTEFRKFKHDYNNLLLSIKTIIESNDSEQIKSYYNELSQQTMSTEHNDSQILVSVDKIINEPIRGLLIQKFFAARKMKMELLIETPDTKIEISNYVVSMVRILGILIDNAIEYLSENLEYEQLIKCAFINHQNSIEIVIENSASELIDLDKIFEQGYTTKGEERGLGLANVSDLVHKIPNLFMSTQLKNNKIQISLILKKEK